MAERAGMIESEDIQEREDVTAKEEIQELFPSSEVFNARIITSLVQDIFRPSGLKSFNLQGELYGDPVL